MVWPRRVWEINKIPDECNDLEATDVQKHFQDTIEFNKVIGRYNVRLPWKDNKENLPTNFTLTKKRLNNLDCVIHSQIVDTSGRYIVVKAAIKDKMYVLVNIYAPNKDGDKFRFRRKYCDWR